MQIPKKLHIIWVGDQSKSPTDCIRSWKKNHPSWEFKLWSNNELRSTDWINREHLQAFAQREKWTAVADLMRYELLYREGGVYVDADSFSIRPMQDWLLENEMFACWEDTLSSARLVNNAFIGSIPKNPFLFYVIEEIGRKKELFRRWSWSRMRYVRMGAWRSVGPYHLTRCIHQYEPGGYSGITLLPSQMFSPTHFRGNTYTGNGLVFADHQWGTTRKRYDGQLRRNTNLMDNVDAINQAKFQQVKMAVV